MNIVTEDLKINHILASGKTQKLVEGDIIVPDTKPDVLKLLQADAYTVVKDKRISDGCTDIDGRVDLTVLYIPDADNENIKSINASFDYSESISAKELLSDDFAIINTYIERIEFSTINSRKLKIKAVVGIEYELLRAEPLSIAVEAEDCENAQIKRESVSVQNSVDISTHTFNVHERIEIPSGQESICELLKYDIKVTDTEYKPLSGKIAVKGAVCICVLYTNSSRTIEFTEAELPFTEIFDCENISEDCCCDIDFSIGECFINTEEDSDGDMRIIDAEAEICAQVRAVEDLEIEMISDCYEPYRKTVLEKDSVSLDEIISRPCSTNTIRDTIEASSNMPSVSGVYDVIAKPYVNKASIEGGRLMCEGKVEAFVLYISDSTENPIFSIKKDIPFSYMLDAQAEGNSLTPQIKAEVKHTGYNLNAAGEIELRILLTINANVVKQRTIELISSAEAQDSNANSSGGIVVYFVQNGDTLWEVAKHYCVPADSIIKFNSLKDETLRTGTRLFIPGR